MASPFAAVDAAVAAFAQEQQIPGLAAGIVQGGRLVHATTVGLADIEGSRPVAAGTAFRIASMTKNMTALAILALRDQGRLALDAPLSTYVPQFAAVAPATSDSPPVSLRHLLTHVAGFVTDDPWGDRVLGMTPAKLDALIGRAITNVSGMPYQTYIRRTILEPLGMRRTTFDAIEASRGDYAWGYRLDDGAWSRERIEPDGEVGAMGGLATTAPDYARYIAFLLSAWPPRDDPESGPVRRLSVREMGLWHAPPHADDPNRPSPPGAYGYGLNNAADAELGRRLHHAGGLPGYGSHVLMIPDKGVGVFAFGNRTYAPMSRLTLQLATILHPSLPKPKVATSPYLERAVEAVMAAYVAGDIAAARHAFAVNFLLDMPARPRNAELASLKLRLGEGRLEKIEPVHVLGGCFTLACERGRLKATIILSPDAEPGIQKLTFTVEE